MARRALPHLHLITCLVFSVYSENTEVCQWESFEGKCAQDEVIIMTKALYGRMDSGRCVKRDYGYVGCFTDALPLADLRCSGRSQCKIGVPDKLFDGTRPCPEDLKLYLEASYECLKVTAPPSGRGCKHDGPISAPVPTGPAAGILASTVTENTGCGSTNSPWRLEAKPGQKWNVTLMDFSRIKLHTNLTAESGRPRAPYGHCHVYAIIKEIPLAKSFTVCGGTPDQERERRMFMSQSNLLEIRMMAGNSNKDAGQFLLKYQVIGCPDPEAPRGGWMSRDGDQATVGCHDTGHSWHLTCTGQSWSGTPENCSGDSASGFHVGLSSMTSFSRTSSMVIVLGVAVVISVLILVIGLIVLKTCVFRRRRTALQRNSIPPSKPTKPKLADKEGLYMTTKGNLDYSHPPLLHRQDPYSTEENEYAYVEEFQFTGSGSTSCACPPEAGLKSPSRDPSRQGMAMTPYSFLIGEQQRPSTGSLKSARGTGSHGDSSRVSSQGGVTRKNYNPPEYFTLEPDGKRNDTCTL